MKKLSLILILACLGIFATSCEEETLKVPASDKDFAKEVAYKYVGDLAIKVGDQAQAPTKSPIFIEHNSPNVVNLVLNNFTFAEGLNIGTIRLDSITVSETTEGIVLNETEFKDYKLSALGELKVRVVAKGISKGDGVELQLEIFDALPGTSQTVKVDFSGKRNNQQVNAEVTKVTSEHASLKNDNKDTKVSTAVINQTTGLITFELAEKAKLEDLTEVVLTIEHSDLSVATPASSTKFDLSKGNATIQVVSEDGLTKKTYRINIITDVIRYDMEDWVMELPADENIGAPVAYTPNGGWGTTNTGTRLIKMFGLIDVFTNVDKTEDAAIGKSAVKLTTLDSKGQNNEGEFPDIPKITSGSIFLGKFTVDIFNTLKSTKFGIPFTKKPLTVSGYYKYLPGKEFYRSTAEKSFEAVVEEKTVDKCSFNAFLYEIEGDNDEYITGLNTYADPRIVAHASFESDGAEKYTSFNLEMNYKKEYDKTKKYRFAIVASTSSQGDTFSGAPGSVMYLDDIVVTAE